MGEVTSDHRNNDSDNDSNNDSDHRNNDGDNGNDSNNDSVNGLTPATLVLHSRLTTGKGQRVCLWR